MTKVYSLILLLLVLATTGNAADVYMSVSGTKTTGKSTANDWSNSNCYSNIVAAFAAMSGGDTLTIDDGSYAGANNVINNNSGHYPPSGTAGAMTIIKARNIPGQGVTPIATPLKVEFTEACEGQNYPGNSSSNFVRYIKWEGIRWTNNFSTWGNWDNNYYKQCAFRGGQTGTNKFIVSIGGLNNLLEDVVAFGIGRYAINFGDYRGSGATPLSNNICRRCIGRLDWANGDGGSANPIGVMSSYYSRGTSFQNSIAIDSDTPNTTWASDSQELAGAFYQPNDSLATSIDLTGSIAINVAMSFYTGAGTGTVFTDVAGAKLAGGIKANSATINRAGFYNLSTDNFTYRGNQLNYIYSKNEGFEVNNSYHSTITNSIVSGVNCGISGSSVEDVSYTNFYSAGTTGCVGGIGNRGTNQITTDPLATGWTYPIRIETGLSLKTSGTSGGQVGPNIMQKIGVDGTFKGETDWNTPQGNLWPWPFEYWIKAEMSALPDTISGKTMPSGTRGFCAANQTLTKYIWEQFGNQIPADIYGSADTTAPTTTSDKAAGRYTASQMVTLSANETATIKYCLTPSCNPTTTYSAPFKALQNIATQTLRYQATDTAGNVEAVRETVLRKQRKK